MVPIVSLWLPILLAAVLVFVASSLIHMVLRYHNSDFRRLPSEDEAMEALRKFNIPPGDYMVPCGAGPEAMRQPAFLEKLNKGPVLMMTVMKTGAINMGSNLAQWFVYCLLVSVFASYVTGRAVSPGADYLQVFRFAGCTAFLSYSVATWQESIWHKRSWSTTAKSTFDGLIYGLLTGGTFGWLWPR